MSEERVENSRPAPDSSSEDTNILSRFHKRESVVIGRGSECDIVVKDAKASRRHCQLSRKENGFLLEDLGSRNGTYVNGRKISEPILLHHNETFRIGETMFYLS